MKKLNIINASLILIISLLCIQPLNGAVSTDIYWTYIDLGDEGSVTGYGITFLWNMMPAYFDNEKLLFYIKSGYASSLKDQDQPVETGLTYVPSSAGIEYRYPVFHIPLCITGSAGAGVSYFKREAPGISDPSQSQVESSFGPYADIMLGLNYVLSQDISVFTKGGYQKSFHKNDEIESPAGLQFTAGVRIALTEVNKGFGGVNDQYEDSDPVFEDGRIYKKSSGKKTILAFYPGMLIPLAKFSEMYNNGFGGMFSLSRKNLFFRNFEGGISTGMYYMTGKSIEEKKKEYDNLILAPLYLTAGYNAAIGKSFIIKPLLSLGCAFLDAKYTNSTNTKDEGNEENLTTVEPSYKAGLLAEYRLTKSLSISIGCEYGIIQEKSGMLNFIVANAGIGYSF